MKSLKFPAVDDTARDEDIVKAFVKVHARKEIIDEPKAKHILAQVNLKHESAQVEEHLHNGANRIQDLRESQANMMFAIENSYNSAKTNGMLEIESAIYHVVMSYFGPWLLIDDEIGKHLQSMVVYVERCYSHAKKTGSLLNDRQKHGIKIVRDCFEAANLKAFELEEDELAVFDPVRDYFLGCEEGNRVGRTDLEHLHHKIRAQLEACRAAHEMLKDYVGKIYKLTYDGLAEPDSENGE